MKRSAKNRIGPKHIATAVSNEIVGVLLDILFTCYEAMRASGVHWRVVTGEAQERGLSRLAGRITFVDGLAPNLQDLAIKSQVDHHPEQFLFAFVMNALATHGINRSGSEAQKFATLAALN